MKTLRQLLGQKGEADALVYLQGEGLQALVSNYRTRAGEVDHIMLDGPTLVFVEVRQRGDGAWVSAAASVTPAKQQRLRRAARHFLLTHKQHAHRTMRFDVVAIDRGELRWLRAAFN